MSYGRVFTRRRFGKLFKFRYEYKKGGLRRLCLWSAKKAAWVALFSWVSYEKKKFAAIKIPWQVVMIMAMK